MKKRKLIPVSKQLFRTYTLVFLLFFLVTSAATTLFLGYIIDRYIIETRKTMTGAISQSIGSYFDEMNEFSMSLMNDNDFKEAVIYELPEALETGKSQSVILQKVYNSSYKMFEKGYRIGAAVKDGTYIWLGDKILVEKLDGPVSTYADYQGKGKPVLLMLEDNAFLHHIPGGEGSNFAQMPVLTLSRSINRRNQFAKPQAMLEIQVPLKEFQAYVEKLQGLGSSDQLRISILDSTGSCFYGEPLPAKALEGPSQQWQRIRGDMVCVDSVFDGSVLVGYSIPAGRYYRMLSLFLGCVAVFYGITLVVMLAVSYYVSQKLTKPIQALSGQLSNLSLTEPEPLSKVDTNIFELDLMAQTVAQMSTQLHKSMEEIVVAQTAEMQSRLMALQSQMEPHFLHNTLAVIGSLSEQGKGEEVSRMCRSLSQMLRYVSAKEDRGVTIYEELLFLKHYLSIMQMRFPQTVVHVDIPLDLMDCRVPKLVLQPLCENAFKYAGKSSIEIFVKGWLEGECWRIQVRDNGAGFSQETIDSILERCRKLFQQKEALSATVGGMGLVNIYARLALFYQEKFIFSIDPSEGITIGGDVHAGKNQGSLG